LLRSDGGKTTFTSNDAFVLHWLTSLQDGKNNTAHQVFPQMLVRGRTQFEILPAGVNMMA
jgi:hypothetical protein